MQTQSFQDALDALGALALPKERAVQLRDEMRETNASYQEGLPPPREVPAAVRHQKGLFDITDANSVSGFFSQFEYRRASD